MPWEETDDFIRSGHGDKSKYDKMRTIELSGGIGVKAVYGHVKGTADKWEVQSYLFSKAAKWTMAKAKAWFASHNAAIIVADVSFDAANVEVGEKWTSVPVTLTKEGVMSGLYKPAEAIRNLKDAPICAIPVVFDHPDGTLVDPEIHDPELFIGIVNELEVVERNNSPVYRGMMHLQNTPETAPQREALTKGQPLGVSIGYYREVEDKSGSWNGTDYHGVESKVWPFHLGVMKDKTPACSIADGCGAGVAATTNQGDSNMPDDKDTPPAVADLSLDSLVGQNKCVAALQKERDDLTVERDELKESLETAENEKKELQTAADELAVIKKESLDARIEALKERLPEKSLNEDDLKAMTPEELERTEKLFPEPDAEEGDEEGDEEGNVGATGGDDAGTDALDDDPNRLYGKPQYGQESS